MINVRCEECGKGYRLKPNMAGKILPCRECGADMEVPARRGGRGERDRGRSAPRSERLDGDFDWEDDQPNSSSAMAIWMGLGVLLITLIAGAVIFWPKGKTDDSDNTETTTDGDTKNNTPPPSNTWTAPRPGVENLGTEIAIGPYSIKVPKGWVPVSSNYGNREAKIEWKWKDDSLPGKLTFHVRLDHGSHRGDIPNIRTRSGNYLEGALGRKYSFSDADDPEPGRIHDVEFHRVRLPRTEHGLPMTKWEYLAMLDGEVVQISTEVKQPEDNLMCQHLEAAALSFQFNSPSAVPVISLDQLQGHWKRVDGLPGTRVIKNDFESWGIPESHTPFGNQEYAILLPKDDLKECILSTPTAKTMMLNNVVYQLSDGKEIGRFDIPNAYKNYELKALSEDGKTLALAKGSSSNAAIKIHLLSSEGKPAQFLQEVPSNTRFARLHAQFLRFQSKTHLMAGWDRGSQQETVDIYNVTNGKQQRIPVLFSVGNAVAVSGDGRFFVGVEAKTRKLFFDSATAPGTQKTELQSPGRDQFFSSRHIKGIEFSPDGKEIAAVHEDNLTVWSINGNILNSIKLDSQMDMKYDEKGPALKWLADGQGWFLFGRFFMDKSGNISPNMLPVPKAFQNLTRLHRLLDGNRVFVAYENNNAASYFAVFKLPAR